ncbi:MAG: glycosyltransferase [Candidatus Omnitrophota bacterium]
MNILQILPELKSGGVERGTIDLADALVSQGHQSVVVSAGGRLVEQLQTIGSKHYRLNVHKKSLFSVINCTIKLIRIIKKEKIDIVHARSRVPAWIGFLACFFTQTKFITTCHGYYSKHFFSRVMGWGKIVIVISQIIGRHMIEDFNVSREKIRLIYRGVDLKDFIFRGLNSVKEKSKNNKKEKVIGIIGRISPIKGHVHFLKAIPIITSQISNLKAVIIGEAPLNRQEYVDELKALTQQLNIEKIVEFMGNVSDIPTVLKKMDLLIMATTTQEAFGRVVIEAGAVGVPVVATRVGGVVEIIDHEKDGLLVESANPHELAQAAIRILKDENLSQQFIKNLREKVVSKFSLNSLVTKTISLYNELIEKEKILVIKLGALGDVILISAALKAIRKRFPQAYIEVLVFNEFKEVLQTCPDIDNLVILNRRGFSEIIRKAYLILKKEYDISIDFQNNNLSHLLAFIGRIKKRFGFKNRKMGFLLNKGILDINQNCSPIEHQFQVLKQLGIDSGEKTLTMWLRDQDRINAGEYLARNWYNSEQLLIGINALASQRWQTKVWQAQNYAKIADMISEKFNARIIFTGMQKDRSLIHEIIALTSCKPINAAGDTSLMQLAAIIERMHVLLTVDSAPMHMAAALKTPFVALFGPTDPTRHLPYLKKSVLIRKDISCSPCYKARCFRKNCMYEITVNEVYQAIVYLIDLKTKHEK